MDPNWLLQLAAAGATTLVGAAATDAWQHARAGFARLFGKGDAEREALAARRLDALASTVEGASPADRDRVRQRELPAWQARLSDLTEEDPTAAVALRRLVDELLARLPAAHPAAIQQITASASGATAQGVMFGQLINHPAPPTRPDDGPTAR